MRHFKQVNGDYISAIGMDICGEEITAEEYSTLLNVIQSKPNASDGYDYRLKTDLTWEQYELPPKDLDPELTAEEALDIIVGGGADA